MMLARPPAVVAGELVRLQTRQHVVALTFDGGGNADGAKGVLAVLRKEHPVLPVACACDRPPLPGGESHCPSSGYAATLDSRRDA
jgi:hypothetical protein